MKLKKNQTVYLDGVIRGSVREAIVETLHRDDSTTIRVMWHLDRNNERPDRRVYSRPEFYHLRVDNCRLRAIA